MKKNQLMTEVGYPYAFFPEEAFHREQVTNMIVDLYMEFAQYFSDEPVIGAGRLVSGGIDHYKLGVFSRIYHLGEDYEPMFMGGEFSEYVREIGDEMNGDLIKMVEFFNENYPMFSLDRDMQMKFQHDIAMALESRNMFYFNSELPYESLLYFQRERGDNIFTRENKGQLFRNMPIVEVW